MDNNIKRESEDLPNEKKKPPLGKSFSSTPTVLNNFDNDFKEENKGQLLTTVSNRKDFRQRLSSEQKDEGSRNAAWTIKIFLN